jgi:membrane protein required for colicin V production
MELIVTDWIIVGVVVVSTLLSIINGFIKECLSLINWFLAFAIAKFFYYDLSQSRLFDSVQPDFKIPLAILVLFIVTLLLGTVAVYVVIRILRKTDGTLSVTDRILGMCFGAMRGVMVVCACLAVCNILFNLGLFSFVQKMSFWEKSAFIPEFNKIVFWFFDKINVTGVLNDVVNTAIGTSETGLPADAVQNGIYPADAASGGVITVNGVSVDTSAIVVNQDGKVVIDPNKLHLDHDVDKMIIEESK